MRNARRERSAPAPRIGEAQRRYVPGFEDPTLAPVRGSMPDQATELAVMLAEHAPDAKLDPPDDAVRGGRDLAAANLRCFLGRQLRAWGEPEAAGLLRRVDDARIRALCKAQEEAGMTVDDRVSAGLALHEVLRKKRMPRNTKPSPRFFQYHVLHAPFGA